jgi:hypothetical protein
MLEITFEYESRLDDLDERLKMALVEKMASLTEMMWSKVIENVSGKLLQTKSGDLKRAVKKAPIEVQGNSIVGTVFVEPAGPKEYALEFGGKGTYPISPKNAMVLSWLEGDSRIFRLYVSRHPAAKDYGYLREALEEMRSIVPEQLQATIDKVYGGAG